MSVEEFEKHLEEWFGITTTNKLSYVVGVLHTLKGDEVPEKITIADIDKVYDDLPSYSSVRYNRDKGDVTQEEVDFIWAHRDLAKQVLSGAADHVRSYGRLD